MSGERERRYAGVSSLAWGWLFIYFDLNLGPVSLTPRFVGYLLFLRGIGCLEEERRDLALLKPLGLLLAGWYGVEWLASWFWGSLAGPLFPVTLLAAVLALYFHFQLLTDCAALAKTYQGPEEALDRRLLKLRTVQAVLHTAVSLTAVLAEMGAVGEALGVCMALVGIGVGGAVMVALFRLRKCFAPEKAA